MQKMEKENSRQRSNRRQGGEEGHRHGVRSLQGVQFCKRIKFAEGYKAGRWERVEECLDSVITNGQQSEELLGRRAGYCGKFPG